MSDIREIDVGSLSGKHFDRMDIMFNAGLDPDKPGESLAHFQSRVRSFLQSLMQKHESCAVLLVSHGGVIMAIQNILANKPPEEMRNGERPANDQIMTLEVSRSMLKSR